VRKNQPHATDTIAIASLIALLLAGIFSPALKAQNQPAGNQAAAQTRESPNDLFVTVGKSVLVDSEAPIERVSTGFGDVADATAVGPREVLVNGKKAGETSLILWQQGGGKLFFDVTVRPSRFVANDRLEALSRQMKKEFPEQKIDLSLENDLVFLRGTVTDLAASDRAMAIASSVGKPVNLLYVNVPKPEAQILLKVRFASVDRTVSDQLGMNLFLLGATNTLGAVTTQQFSPPLVGSSTSDSSGGSSGKVGGKGGVASLTNALNLFFFRPDIDLGATIQALEAKGLLEILAEPNVLAENAKQASFLAGGEFPYPVVQGASVGGTNAVTIQFRQFGVRLNFIPTVTPRGTIHLQVAPEVSALDYTNGVTVSGFTVPGITVRNVNTEVELSEGQSFAIGGLLDNRETQTLEKIPFIGDIPILGKFFQSRTRTKQNTELMVIVTPQFVRPIPAGQPVPQLNYPVPFLPANSGIPMATPGQNVTGPVPVTPPTATIPVEMLIKSLQTEKPLVVTSTSGSSGAAPYNSGQQMPSAPPSSPGPPPAGLPGTTPQ
jgi:pilus assembly protein CpaC